MRGADALILAPGDGIAASVGALGVPPPPAAPKRLPFPASRLVGSLPLGALRHDSWFSLSLSRFSELTTRSYKIVFQFQAPGGNQGVTLEEAINRSAWGRGG